MKDTITRLEAEIEELKKRLSAIFISHTTADQLKSIKDYFDSVQTYLQNLTTSFDTHITDCEVYGTQIAELQKEVATINQTLNSLPDFEGFDTTEIKTQMETLTSKVAEFETKLESLIGENDTSLDAIVNDISALQTDVGDIQDQIDSINTEISSINETIGSMQTTITNLSSTQNSLSSAQNSMSSNINSIDSRLTTAENNISAMTGDIDLTEIGDNLKSIESDIYFKNPFSSKTIIKNRKSYNNKFFTPEVYFITKKTGKIKIKFNLEITSEESQVLTENIYINKSLIKTIEYSQIAGYNAQIIEFDILPKFVHNSIQLEITTQQEITVNLLNFELMGAGAHIFDYYKDLMVHCFDNKAFITKIEDDVAYYDEFDSSNIDLSALANSYNMAGDVPCIHFEYIPYIAPDSSTGTFSDYVYALISDTPDGKRHVTPTGEIETANTALVATEISAYMYTAVNYTRTYSPMMYVIHRNNYPAYFSAFSFATHYKMYNFASHGNGDWVYIKSIIKNHNSISSNYEEGRLVDVVALNEDGYFYYMNAQYAEYALKLGKGVFATAYKHSDNTINVYISDFYKTDKYKLTVNGERYESTYDQTIDDCDCIYETFNNNIIKHNVSTDSWEVSTLEY